MGGTVDGINEAGLSITCNYAYATDKGPPGPTITMLIAEAMSRLKTVPAAVEFFRGTPRSGGGMLMLGDAEGRIAAIDISNSRESARDPERDRLFHSNRYCSPSTKEVELDAAAVYARRSPRALQGRRVHQSADCRDVRLRELLYGIDALDVKSVQDVMADHGETGTPSADTICMHSDYWHTTATVQLLPVRRTLRASFSPTCVAEYKEYFVE